MTLEAGVKGHELSDYDVIRKFLPIIACARAPKAFRIMYRGLGAN